jgi:adenylate kinase family enzyme
VIGSDGKKVTAVFAQSPGALQLLPSEEYGPKWLNITQSGRTVASLPVSDPYEEIYLQRGKWWGLIREEWLSPADGKAIGWDKFAKNVKLAKAFHRKIAKHYHSRTYVFYGGGDDKSSFSNILWQTKKGVQPASDGEFVSEADVPNLNSSRVRTDGSNNLYVGGEAVVEASLGGDAPKTRITEMSFWEIRCASRDSNGDGTVPARSGRAPRQASGKNVLQQFEIAGIQHEPAYRDYPITQQVTYYAVTKLAALADLS